MKSQIRDWRKIASWSLILVAAVLGLLALLWPNLWAFAAAFALTGVIARYAS